MEAPGPIGSVLKLPRAWCPASMAILILLLLFASVFVTVPVNTAQIITAAAIKILPALFISFLFSSFDNN